MIRKTLTILSLICLLLSVGLWGVSYWKPVMLDLASWFWDIGLRDGYLEVGVGMNILTFPTESGDADLRTYDHIYSIPLWFPTLLFSAISFWLCVPLHRRRKRKKLGLCVKCGYDLRASKERCPECGTTMERWPGAASTPEKRKENPAAGRRG